MSGFGINDGIYTISDISMILNLPGKNLRRWTKDYWNARFAKGLDFQYSVGEGRERTLNFYALIEFYTFYQLKEYGVPTRQILKAHEALSRDLNTAYPFATQNILTDGNRVLFSPEKELIVDADGSRQINIKRMLDPFCKKIDFGTDNKLAVRFWPKGKKSSIIVDPKHHFGQPVINGTNITAEVLYSLYTAGESINFIATLYDIDKKSVVDAIDFFKKAA